MYQLFFAAAVATVWVPAARADLILNTPAGLAPGQQFRIVFVTNGTTQAESTDISTYNSFVNGDAAAQANGNVFYNGQLVNFSAIGSTATVNAIDNVGVSSAPVYSADGTLIADSTTTDAGGLWSGKLLAGIGEDLSGNLSSAGLVYTGSLDDGTGAFLTQLGSVITDTELGFVGHATFDWDTGGAAPFDREIAMYGISDVLTVAAVAAPEPTSVLLTLTGLGSAFGWRLTRRREPAEHLSPETLA
jgi:hypothetical protein